MNGTKNRKDNIKKYLLFRNTSFGVVYMCDEVEDTIGVASLVTIPDRVSSMKSEETTTSSVYPRIPFISPTEAALIVSFIYIVT